MITTVVDFNDKLTFEMLKVGIQNTCFCAQLTYFDDSRKNFGSLLSRYN